MRCMAPDSRLFLRPITAALTAALILSACAEPEEEEVVPPEIAEIETEPGEMPPHEFEAVYPITAEDVGEIIVASGTVVGTPGPAGFFLEAEGDRVLFIDSTQPVTVGQEVSVTGPMEAAEVTVFEGWEEEFLGDVEADWETIRLFYVDATNVTPLG